MIHSMNRYKKAAHRVQTAIAVLIELDPNYTAAEPKHMRVGVDLSKSDAVGLARLLMAKGVFTNEEYVAAITVAAEEEAASYERIVQSVAGDRRLRTL